MARPRWPVGRHHERHPQIRRIDHVEDGRPAKHCVVTGADIAAQIQALKDQPGKNIAISGSASLTRRLLQQGLLDELRLPVHPIIVGTGTRLFSDERPCLAMDLVTSKTHATGVLDLTYRPGAS